MGGTSLTKSITIVRNGDFGSRPITHIRSTLGKHVSNIRMVSDNIPNNTVGVHMHNTDSIGGDGSPLCMMSNVIHRANLRNVDPRSVRDVRILGSTSSATVCNTHNTGNIIVMRAGDNGTNTTRIAFSNDFNFSGTCGVPRMVNAGRCTRTLISRGNISRDTMRSCLGNAGPNVS